MNLRETIQQLDQERARITQAITTLEELANGNGQHYPGKRRGRKAMGPEERKEVSARMKRYWATRRKR